MADTSGAAASQATPDDLAEGRRLLEGVRDNVFSFDDPAFYWFCRHVQQQAEASLFSIRPDEFPTPWKYLLERPSDYRGQLVVVGGLLQAVHAYDVSNRPGIGTLYQCELSEAGSRAFCTVVVAQNPRDIALHSRVRAKGYFIKIRAFQTTAGDAGAGPLLVARALQSLQSPPPSIWNRSPREQGSSSLGSITFWLVSGTAGLAIVWLILRRHARMVRPGADRPARGAFRPEKTESEEDFDWLTKADPVNGKDERNS